MKNNDIERDVSVFIVTEDYQTIPAIEYDYSLDGEGHFVMLTNDMLNPEYGNDNTLYIHKTHNKINTRQPVIRHLLDMKQIDSQINIEICEKYLKEIYEKDYHKDDYKDFREYFDCNAFDFICDNLDLFSHEPIHHPNMIYNISQGQPNNRFIWSVERRQIKSLRLFEDKYMAMEDLDGYSNTQKIINESKLLYKNYNRNLESVYPNITEFYQTSGFLDYAEQYAPAAFAASGFKVIYEGRWYYGYLPAFGQLQILEDNYSKLFWAMDKLCHDFSFFGIGKLWSSTQCDNEDAWVFNSYKHESCLCHKDTGNAAIFPLIKFDF